jgi:hypothetical protein
VEGTQPPVTPPAQGGQQPDPGQQSEPQAPPAPDANPWQQPPPDPGYWQTSPPGYQPHPVQQSTQPPQQQYTAPQFVSPGGHLVGQPAQAYAYPGGLYVNPGPVGPTNGLAIASVITATSSLGVLLLSIGFAAPLTMIASIIAVVLGHKGKKAVDEGRTPRSRDAAMAGFWTGIAGIVLSFIAIGLWVLVIVLASGESIAPPGELS